MSSVFGGQQGTSTTTTTNQPWQPQQGSLLNQFKWANQTYKNAMNNGPSQNTANSYTMAANQANNPTLSTANNYAQNVMNGTYNSTANNYLNGTMNGTNSSPYSNYMNSVVNGTNTSPTGSYVNNVLSGQYLSPTSNPFLQQSEQLAMQNAQGGNASAGTRYGAYGGSDYQNLNAQTNANIAAQMGNNAYNTGISQMENAGALGTNLQQQQLGAAQTGLNNQMTAAQLANQQTMNAANLAPSLNNSSASNVSLLNSLGNQQQNYPWTQLQNYAGLVDGNYGGTSQTQAPYYGSGLLGTALGGLGTIAGAGGSNGFGWWG